MYSRTCHLIFPSIRSPLNMLTTNRILHLLNCLVGLHKLDLCIYTTTYRYPNVKQLSWVINHCACWPQTKSCTSSPAWLGGFHKKRLWRAAVAGKWTRIFASFERSPFRRALFACFSTNSLPAPLHYLSQRWLECIFKTMNNTCTSVPDFSSPKDHPTNFLTLNANSLGRAIHPRQHLGSVALDFLGPALDIEAEPEPGIIGFPPLPPLWLVNSCSLA